MVTARQTMLFARGFLMVSIECGGNIPARTCQETHWLERKRTMRVGLYITICSLLLGTVCSLAEAGDSLSIKPKEPAARIFIVRDPEATEAFRPRLEHIRAMM